MQFSVTHRQILRLAAPISLSLLIPQLSFMANAIFLGRVGQLELVVNGLSGIFYLLLTYIGFGLSNGILVQLSRRAGEGNHAGLSKTFTNGIFLSVLGALFLMMISFWLVPLIFGWSLHDEHVFYGTVDFLYLRIWGLPFLMLSQLANAFYIATNRSRLLIYGPLVASGVTIILDYLLIFGHAGFPEMGLQGAALASVLGEVLLFAVLYGLFFLKKLHKEYQVFRYFYPDGQLSRQTLKVALPLIIQYAFGIGAWQVFYIYIEHMGVTQLAASHILRSVLGIVSIGTWALASVSNTMVSNVLGQGQPGQVLPLVRKIIKISLGYTLVISVFLFCFPATFLSAYTGDPAVVAMGVPSLRVLSVSVLIMSVATVCFNAVVGTGNTFVNLGIEIGCVLLYLVYITIVVEKMQASLPWAWASEFVYWTTLLLTAGGYLLWQKGKGRQL